MNELLRKPLPWIIGIGLMLYVLAGISQCAFKKVANESTATVVTPETTQQKASAHTPDTYLWLAKQQIKQKHYSTARLFLDMILRTDKEYVEARSLMRTVEPRAKKEEARLRRQPPSEEWSKERIELELAIHPERKEQMVRDTLKMHDAIKEKYGTEAALRFLQSTQR